MSSPLARLQRLLPWSNTRRAWTERLSLFGFLVVVGVLIVWSAEWPAGLQVTAWAALLLAAAVLFRNDWLKLFGPILRYDLVRTARRVRTYLVRGGYLLVLLAVLGVFYMNAWPWYRGGRIMNSEAARFAEDFCYTFLITQFVLMTLLTPAFTAGAVAEEKQKKTIQFLLITDLRNHEIVLGKLGSRMTHLGLLLLAGLPVLGAVEFLGGVDPHIVLAGFAGTAVTMASAAGLSILASAIARPPRFALFLAYGWIIAYVGLCFLGVAARYWLVRSPYFAAPGSLLDPFIDVVEAGNPVEAVQTVVGSDPIEPALLRALGAYALFHGVVAGASTLAASLLLRRASLREPRPARERKGKQRAAVGDQPVLWKEAHTGYGKFRRWATLAFFGLGVGFSLFVIGWALYERAEEMRQNPQWYGHETYWTFLRTILNGWVRVVGTIVACLTLLGVALNAAQSIRIERDRQTYESLLTCPLTSEEILYGKWMGAILSVRGLLPWLVFIWIVGVAGGGLSPLAVPPLVLAWCVYAAAMAGIGLWFSLVSRTTTRAVLYTMMAVLGLSVGHWLIWLLCACVPPLAYSGDLARLMLVGQAGLTPPVVLGVYLPFGYEEHFDKDIIGPIVVSTLIGLVVWGVFAWMAWQATNQRFKRDGGRVDAGAIRERVPAPRRLS